ncbi:MAG: spermidine/putrescine ABC transporter substrate-binding protein [Anaerolineales bacterium]|nr:spermidine/putrescine ABC transporter substrate-binding protein [Anaerolineales bacterium]
MKKILYPLLLFVMILLLAACGGGPAGGPAASEPETASDAAADTGSAVTGETAVSEEGPQLADEISVYNWADYIDEELLTAYEEEYGVHILYDTFASNEDLLAKLQAGATGYDVIVPSDYMVFQMIELGLLAEIDTAQMPNFANIGDEFKNAPFDPGNKHCVPYQWGTSGIAYQPSHPVFAENPPNSWAYLFDPAMLEQYAGDGINVLNDSRELMAAALVYLGYEGNSQNPDEIAQARDVVIKAKPYYKTFNSEDYDDTLLIAGEVVISHSWSGDAANAYWSTYDEATEQSEWAYTIPEEGAVKWLDNICITASSQKYETAVHFINYLLDAENGAAITNFTYYASPNEAAKAYIVDEILNDPSIYPPEDVQSKLYWLTQVGDAVFLYDEAWTAIKGQ